MALSRTNVISTATAGQIAGGSLTTGSFTPANNSLLVIVYHMQSSLTTFSPTITDNLGSHLTYTNQVQIGPDTTNHHATAIFTAPVTTGALMTITCGGGPTDSTYEAIIHVYTYTGYNTSTPVGAKASGNNVNFAAASSITLSAAPATTSEVIAGFQDDVGTIVVGAGWTTQFTGTDTANIFSLDETRTGSTSTSVAWAASGSGVTGVAAAIEVQVAASTTLPPGDQSFETPQPDRNTNKFPPNLRHWRAMDRTILIGKDSMVPGKQWFRPPHLNIPDERYFPRQLRSWTGWYNLNLVGKDQLPPGDQWFRPTKAWMVPDPFARWRSWTGSYNLNLIGKDSFPPGDQTNYVPSGVTWRPESPPPNLLNTLLFTPPTSPPPGEQVFDLPPRAGDPFAQWRTWSGSYNLNLIGQDAFPPGEQTNFLPSGATWRPESPPQNLLSTLLAPQPPQALPPGEQLFDLPPRMGDPFAQWRSWTGWFNLNLTGQERFPVGAIWDDLPPYAPRRGTDFVPTVNIALLTQVIIPPPPGQQLYANPAPPLDTFAQWRSWSGSYNLNLIGKDRLPPGKQTYALSPSGPPPLTPTGALFNINLFPPPPPPVHGPAVYSNFFIAGFGMLSGIPGDPPS